jgi:hypothetical protein
MRVDEIVGASLPSLHWLFLPSDNECVTREHVPRRAVILRTHKSPYDRHGNVRKITPLTTQPTVTIL